ncbi:hypothetical protein IL306_001569 [Fusarium sp. DS 682]|nr:hypothetical protein IL306_001569 [Fusarium sp. DS 682]
MTILSKILLQIALYGTRFAFAQQAALPASFGPPADSDPLSWGFYATHEIREPTHLEIVGEIPAWVTHWFDGFSRNHRFEIANGAVSYRSRNGSDELIEIVRETGLYPGGSFGGDPCKIIFGGFETTYRDGVDPVGDKSSANVGVTYAPNFAGMARNKSGEAINPFDT